MAKSQTRIKQTGEIFTPLDLVDEMLERLPLEMFTDPKKRFVDPACGDGNFLVRVIAYKIYYGSTAEEALDTTCGVELMEDNAVRCRDRVLTHAWLAHKLKYSTTTEFRGDMLHNDITLEDERQAGQKSGRDEFCRPLDKYVVKNIVCRNSLEWDFDNWQSLLTNES